VPTRLHRLAVWPLLAASLVLVASSCSKSDGSDPERTGPTKQAVERLHDFGLTTEQARCVVDEVGAASVVEATDLNALTGSQEYQDAAKTCLDDA
jgi:hypothetical protein